MKYVGGVCMGVYMEGDNYDVCCAYDCGGDVCVCIAVCGRGVCVCVCV